MKTLKPRQQHPSEDLSPLKPLLTEKTAAQILCVTPRCLQNWRMTGYGPRHVRLSATACRYRPEDLEAWIESRLRSSTSDPDPRGER